MLRKKVLIGCVLLSLVAVTLAASAPTAQAWRALFDDLLGEGGTHLATVRGTVQFDGVILFGGDFTVTKTGTGMYRVLYTGSPYGDAPTVLVQIVGTDVLANEAVAYVESETLVGFNVETKVAGALTDHSFKFIAVGPASSE